MTERQKIIRVLKAVVGIPMPRDGSSTQTRSISGINDYLNDMRNAIRFLNSIINSMIYKEDIDEHDVNILEQIQKGEY